jgi:hypothetical protein
MWQKYADNVGGEIAPQMTTAAVFGGCRFYCYLKVKNYWYT